MNRIPRDFINELIARTDLVALIDARVPLKKSGVNYSACCPFHQEKTPSFTVSQVKQFYHCFGCGASGNAISFLLEFDRLDFVSAVEYLAAQLGLTVPHEGEITEALPQTQNLYQLLDYAAKYYRQQLKQSANAIAYLKQRGLTGEIVKAYGIGYAPTGWDHLLQRFGATPEQRQQLLTAGMLIKKDDGQGFYDRFRERIMFPIRDRRGRVIAFGGRVLDDSLPKYLNSPETPIFHKGSELYGLYEARQANRDLQQLLVVEGYMDVVALAQHGISYAVATLGTATTADHIRQLARHTDTIIFCFDGDNAGKQAAWRALTNALPVVQDGLQLRFLFLPDGEDPDSLVRKIGAAAFAEKLKEAIAFSDFLFGHLRTQVGAATLDGKAQLVKLATPLLQQMPAGALRHLIVERLAQLSGISLAHLLKLLNINDNNQTVSTTTTGKRKILSPMRWLIALLIQHPELVIKLNELDDIKTWQLPGAELLRELINVMSPQKNLTTGHLLEYFREHADYRHLVKLAAWQHSISAEMIVAEFQATLLRVRQMDVEYSIEQLLQKAQQQGLTADEKVVLQKLLTMAKN